MCDYQRNIIYNNNYCEKYKQDFQDMLKT